MRKIIFSFHVMLTTHSIQQSKCFLSNHLFSCFLLLSSFCRFSSVCISIIMFILWKYYLFLSIFLSSFKLVYYFLSTGWSLFFRYRLSFIIFASRFFLFFTMYILLLIVQSVISVMWALWWQTISLSKYNTLKYRF
jgi:hypothetical protein